VETQQQAFGKKTTTTKKKFPLIAAKKNVFGEYVSAVAREDVARKKSDSTHCS